MSFSASDDPFPSPHPTLYQHIVRLMSADTLVFAQFHQNQRLPTPLDHSFVPEDDNDSQIIEISAYPPGHLYSLSPSLVGSPTPLLEAGGGNESPSPPLNKSWTSPIADLDSQRNLAVTYESLPMNSSVKDVNLVTWDGPHDPMNPHNWSFRRRWVATIAVSGFTFMR